MRIVAAAIALLIAACGTGDTSRLAPDDERQFSAEGILHRADNVVFRWTEGGGRSWEDRRASIIITRQTVLIHKNDKIGLRITKDSRKLCEVHRERDRVRIGFGSGAASEIWSFVPADDAESWTTDIRAMLRQLPCGDRSTPR